MSLKTFVQAFWEAALWAECANVNPDDENDDTSFDRAGFTVEDIAEATRTALEAECKVFYENESLRFDEGAKEGYTADEMAGHNFWLNRNGHGVGFWDGDYPENGDYLSAICDDFGQVDLYVGDDGLIYAMGYEKGAKAS